MPGASLPPPTREALEMWIEAQASPGTAADTLLAGIAWNAPAPLHLRALCGMLWKLGRLQEARYFAQIEHRTCNDAASLRNVAVISAILSDFKLYNSCMHALEAAGVSGEQREPLIWLALLRSGRLEEAAERVRDLLDCEHPDRIAEDVARDVALLSDDGHLLLRVVQRFPSTSFTKRSERLGTRLLYGVLLDLLRRFAQARP